MATVVSALIFNGLTVSACAIAGADNINAVLSSSNAGFIKAHFDNLTQNEIAGITYDDIRLTFPDNAEYKHVFNVDENSFANAVPYVEEI